MKRDHAFGTSPLAFYDICGECGCINKMNSVGVIVAYWTHLGQPLKQEPACSPRRLNRSERRHRFLTALSSLKAINQ